MRPKLHAVRANFPNLRQAENLKSPAVSKNRRSPIHKPMQPARRSDNFHAGPDIQVIRIAK